MRRRRRFLIRREITTAVVGDWFGLQAAPAAILMKLYDARGPLSSRVLGPNPQKRIYDIRQAVGREAVICTGANGDQHCFGDYQLSASGRAQVREALEQAFRSLGAMLSNDVADAQVIALKEALGFEVIPAEAGVLGLSPTERKLFAILKQSDGFVPLERLFYAVWGQRAYDGEIDPKIVQVYLCKMRKKVAAHGWQIENRWGSGYQLSQIAPCPEVQAA